MTFSRKGLLPIPATSVSVNLDILVPETGTLPRGTEQWFHKLEVVTAGGPPWGPHTSESEDKEGGYMLPEVIDPDHQGKPEMLRSMSGIQGLPWGTSLSPRTLDWGLWKTIASGLLTAQTF